MAELAPEHVAVRLARLRGTTLMTLAEARVAMAPSPRDEPFARAAERRLEELRALSDLTTALHASARSAQR